MAPALEIGRVELLLFGVFLATFPVLALAVGTPFEDVFSPALLKLSTEQDWTRLLLRGCLCWCVWMAWMLGNLRRENRELKGVQVQADPGLKEENKALRLQLQEARSLLEAMAADNLRLQQSIAAEPTVQCPICYEDYRKGRLSRTLKCGHPLCSTCLEKMETIQIDTCPLCRQDMRVIVEC